MTKEFVITQDDAISLLTGDITIQCPHCLRHTVPVIATRPIFKQIVILRPTTVGIVCLCPACRKNIYLQSQIQYAASTATVIRASTDFIIKEKADSFSISPSVPEQIIPLWKEAWICYINGCYNAFSAMVRKTKRAIDFDLEQRRSIRNTEIEEALQEYKEDTTEEDVLEATTPIFRMHSQQWLALFLADWELQFQVDEESKEIWLFVQLVLTQESPISIGSKEKAEVLFNIMTDLLNQVYIRPFAIEVMKTMPPNKTQ